jgi:hypothetical protein
MQKIARIGAQNQALLTIERRQDSDLTATNQQAMQAVIELTLIW